MLRRLHHAQPESFAFTPANAEWAKGQIAKYPEGRQASAVIPLLWRAQEQEGWVTRPMIETIAKMLGMAEIRVLEVASFYFMFQMAPVGSVAHIQVCGTTSCMICGAEDLVSVCQEKIAKTPHTLSADGKFSWEEVECLGACSNAPMVQIGKDYYEDLDRESFETIIDELAAGKVPVPGSRKGRFSSEPLGGLTSLKDFAGGHKANASVELATTLGDSIKRIDGSEKTASDLIDISDVRITEAQLSKPPEPVETPGPMRDPENDPIQAARPEPDAATMPESKDEIRQEASKDGAQEEPQRLSEAQDGAPDDLKKIKGVGPKLEQRLNDLGVFRFDQIAAWTADDVAQVDERLSFKGRIERDGWIEQAKTLAAGKGD